MEQVQRVAAKFSCVLNAGLASRPGQPMSEDDLRAFEQQHGIRLPEDYRLFLATIGEGASGPDYGFNKLTVGHVVSDGEVSDLARPFPLVPGVDYSKDWGEAAGLDDENFYAGLLYLGEIGCGLTTHLVATGPARGRVFHYGDYPLFAREPTFLDWYEIWLDRLLFKIDPGGCGFALKETEPEILGRLRGETNPSERAYLLSVLGLTSVVTERSHAVLLEGLESPEPSLRQAAVIQLGRIGTQFLPVITSKLADPDRDVRGIAAFWFRGEPALVFSQQLVEALMRETESSVMFTLAQKLLDLGRLSLDALRPLIGDPRAGMHRYVAYFFSKLDQVEGMEGFERLLIDEDIHVRIYARQGFMDRDLRKSLAWMRKRLANVTAEERADIRRGMQVLIHGVHYGFPEPPERPRTHIDD